MGLSARADRNLSAHFALLLTAGLVFTCWLQPSRARAYRTAADLAEFEGAGRVAWFGASPRVELSTHGMPSALTSADVQAVVEEAVGAWNGIACSEARLRFAGTTASPPGPDDNTNTIGWVSEGWVARGFSPDAAATTDLRYGRVDGHWVIVEADIYLNADTQVLVLGPASSANERDVHVIIAHEIGHLLGLAHNCLSTEPGELRCGPEDASALMYPDYQPGGPRTPAADDVAGLCWLYPPPAAPSCVADSSCLAPSLGDPCSMDRECATGLCGDSGYCTRACGGACPSGFRCTEGFCQPGGAGYGETCRFGEDCASGLCLLGPGEASECTRACDVACPVPDTCQTVQGREVCRRPSTSSGCSTTGASGGPPSPLFWMLFCGVLLRRRRAASARSQPRGRR